MNRKAALGISQVVGLVVTAIIIILVTVNNLNAKDDVVDTFDDTFNLSKYIGEKANGKAEIKEVEITETLEADLENYFQNLLKAIFSEQEATETGLFYAVDRLPSNDDLQSKLKDYTLVFLSDEMGTQVYVREAGSNANVFRFGFTDYEFLQGKQLCVLPVLDSGDDLQQVVTKHLDVNFNSEETGSVEPYIVKNKINFVEFRFDDENIVFRTSSNTLSDEEDVLLHVDNSIFDYVFYRYQTQFSGEEYICFLPAASNFKANSIFSSNVEIDDGIGVGEGFADKNLGNQLREENKLKQVII